MSQDHISTPFHSDIPIMPSKLGFQFKAKIICLNKFVQIYLQSREIVFVFWRFFRTKDSLGSIYLTFKVMKTATWFHKFF